MNKKIAIELAVGLIVLIALAFGAVIMFQPIGPNGMPKEGYRDLEIEKINQPAQIANPASVYCQENGGKLEIAGNQGGICTLANGTQCEEWKYFRGECGYDMKDWQTYNGEKTGYAFELKFPKGWMVQEFRGYPPSFSNDCVYANGDRCASFSVFGLLDATADTKLMRDVNLDLTGKYPDMLIKEEMIKVSGKEALLTEYYESSLGKDGELQRRMRVDIKIIHNGKVYRFTMEESGKGTEKFTSSADWKYKRELNAILSSLKFTK